MTLVGPDARLWGVVANVAGLRLLLSLGVAAGNGIFFHPAGIHFSHADQPAVKTLAFAWSTKPTEDFITFTRSEPYGGEPIDHF